MSLLPTKIIHVDSDRKYSGTHSNFTFSISFNNQEFDRVSVLSVSVPKTFYLVNEQNNKFILQEEDVNTEITLTVGNYSLRNLSLELTSKMNAATSQSQVYSVTIPSQTEPQTGKLTIYEDNITTLPTKLIFYSSLAKVLGFELGSTNIFNLSSLSSVNVCFLTISEIYLKSNLVQANNNKLGDDILISINIINVPDFSAISYQSNDVFYSSKPINSVNTNNVSFIFTDGDDNILDFNGISCNIDLVLFKYDDTNSLIKKDIKTRHLSELIKNESI